MRRPDQDRFDLFARPLECLDEQLQTFADRHGFQLEKNPDRQPGRILRRIDDIQQVIDLSQDDHWLQVDYRFRLTLLLGCRRFLRVARGPLYPL